MSVRWARGVAWTGKQKLKIGSHARHKAWPHLGCLACRPPGTAPHVAWINGDEVWKGRYDSMNRPTQIQFYRPARVVEENPNPDMNSNREGPKYDKDQKNHGCGGDGSKGNNPIHAKKNSALLKRVRLAECDVIIMALMLQTEC